jgi:hypothetical protein
VLDIDVKGYFDSIDWELLLKAVHYHTDCPWVLLYIERWLKAPVQMEDGAPEIQTVASQDQGGARLVCAASLCKSDPVRSLAAMSWQRPNIGSRMNREVHVRFWERAEVKFPRATRQEPRLPHRKSNSRFSSISGPYRPRCHVSLPLRAAL